MAEDVERGLRKIGQEADSLLCIFAGTRAEWMLTAQACFKQSFPVVTL
jgi:long-chain acyl-CoA synthetase